MEKLERAKNSIRLRQAEIILGDMEKLIPKWIAELRYIIHNLRIERKEEDSSKE